MTYRANIGEKWRQFSDDQIEREIRRGKFKGYLIVLFIDGKQKVKKSEIIRSK